MDVLPECAWDAECGLIVLYREDPGRSDGGPYALVVEPRDGQAAYYAGDLPAGTGLWAVRAPVAEQFRLLFYAAGTANPLAAEPVASIPFDAALRADPQVPAGAFRQLGGWLFLPGGDDEDIRGPLIQRIEVPAGQTIQGVLADQGWAPGDRCGISCARASGTGAEAVRGPSSHPFHQMRERIEVSFSVVPDPRPLPEDAVRIDELEQLDIPAIILDLTPFGDLDALLSEGFCFIHGRHGSELGPECTYGSASMLHRDADGRRLLIWPCTDACHLDLLGVYYAGGHRLVPREDPVTGVRLQGIGEADDGGLLLAQYFGDDYRVQPRQSVEMLQDLGMDPTELALELRAGWILDRKAWPDADWRGAEHAEAFTLVAFGGALNALLRMGAEGRLDAALADLAEALPSFSHFGARPELAFAMSDDGDLSAALARRGPRTESLLDPDLLSPVSALAAALEPGLTDLGPWMEGQDPGSQYLLWRFMLAGGRASHWRDLAFTPELAIGQDLERLAGRVRLAMDPPHLPAYVAVLEDLGIGSGTFARAPRGLADVDERLRAMMQADQALGREIEGIDRDLAFAGRELRIDRSAVLAGLESALGAGGLADLDTLRGRLSARAVAMDRDLIQLAGAIEGLRLRATVLALADALGLDLGESPSEDPFDPDVQSDPWLASGEPAEDPLRADQPGDARRPPAPAYIPAARVPDPAPRDGETRDEPAEADPADLVLAWCAGAMRHQGLVFPPPGPAAAPADAGALDALLDDLEDYWGLAEGMTPEPLPQWRGERQRTARRLLEQWRSGIDRVRSLAADAHGMGPGVLLRRMERARDCIIAEMLWGSIQSDARDLRQGGNDARIADLARRMGQAAPADWDALAAVLETLRGSQDRATPAASLPLHAGDASE